MSLVIPESHLDLLTQLHHVMFVTLMPDGQPQASIVWRVWDAPQILISSHKNSQKTRNVSHDPRVTLIMADPQNAYRYLEIRGLVTLIEDDPEYTFLDRVTHAYLQKPYYGGAEPIEDKGKIAHVVLHIQPQKINVVGYQQLV
jgi:PPOX class probable F420-dependent enzyme